MYIDRTYTGNQRSWYIYRYIYMCCWNVGCSQQYYYILMCDVQCILVPVTDCLILSNTVPLNQPIESHRPPLSAFYSTRQNIWRLGLMWRRRGCPIKAANNITWPAFDQSEHSSRLSSVVIYPRRDVDINKRVVLLCTFQRVTRQSSRSPLLLSLIRRI